MPENLVSSLVFILILYIAIAVHEFGHALGCYLVKCKVDEFYIGFLPVLKFTVKSLPVTIGILPLGGGALPNIKEFDALSPGKRIIPIAFGPIFSFVTAVAALTLSAKFTMAEALNLVFSIFPVLLTPAHLLPQPDSNTGTMLTSISVYMESQGFTFTLLLFGFVNTLLFAFNTLPIPGLDGGRILLNLVEMTFGPKVKTLNKVLNGLGIITVFGYVIISWILDLIYILTG